MKTFKFAFLGVLLYTASACAQDFPKTPATSSNNDIHTEVTSTVSNSTSVSNSDNIYKFTSKFHLSKRKGILDILEDELNALEIQKKGNQYLWSKEQYGKTIFECKLSKNTLKIFLDKDESTYQFNKRVKNLGDELRIYISAHKSFSYATSSNSVGDAQVRVDKAKEELKRSLRNLENIKRNQ